MREHAQSCYPNECVGALFTDGDAITHCLPLTNAAESQASHFALSARDYLRAEREAERLQLQLCGFYHSHPDGSAQPSPFDDAQAPKGLWTFIIPVTRGAAHEPRGYWYDVPA